jgi:hypothetical protein
MRAPTVRVLQRTLIQEGHDPGEVDGRLGDNTYGAVQEALSQRGAALPSDWTGWNNHRKAVAYVQLLCREHDIEVGKVDGFWGPQTDYAFETLAHLLARGVMPLPWRDEVPLDVNPNGWPRQDETPLTAFYGPVGEHQVRVELPYPHRLAWNLAQTVTSFSCHERVHDSLKRVLRRVLDHYGLDEIRALRLDRWGGCFAVRKMRGGTRWSMHAWGIAVDYDPDRNQLKWGRDRAAFAQPEYQAWWSLWEEEGWLSLGRTRNFDWMHMQAAKL